MGEEGVKVVRDRQDMLGESETHQFSISIAQEEEVVACYLVTYILTGLGEAL